MSLFKTTCPGPHCFCGDSFLVEHDSDGQKNTSVFFLPTGIWRLALVVAIVLQGCVKDLAGLPGTSFNAPSRNTAIGEDPQHADSLPSKVTLTGETRQLLDRFSYEQQVHPGQQQTKRLASDRENTGPVTYQDASDQTLPGQEVQAVGNFTIEAVDAPVQAMLFSLANDARMQLRVNGQLDASVTINAVNQSLEEIMNLLARQADFSWQQEHGVLSVWDGQAYAMSYPIDYLNMHRRTQSSVGLATQVGTINASAGDSGSIANSSQTRVENTSEHHFWDSLLTDVQSIVRQGSTIDAAAVTDFSINREAGLLSLYAAPEVHRNLQRYLKQLHGSTQRQVLIEATVVEVALSDSFEAGVDWQVLANGISGVNAAQVLLGAPQVAADTINRIAAPAGLVSLVHQGSNGDMRATLSLLEQFGDVRILSRPRIIALNNQSSVLKVVDNRVYFTVNVQRRQTEERDEVVTETDIHTVPVGLVMNVTPYISKRGSVMLNVRPTLSRILGFVNDPNPELALANVRNGVPEIQVREMESMLQVNSGEVAIIGGLMQETHSDNDARLPGLGSLPGIGRLFSKNSRERRQTELLIVLRPTVLDSTPSEAYP